MRGEVKFLLGEMWHWIKTASGFIFWVSKWFFVVFISIAIILIPINNFFERIRRNDWHYQVGKLQAEDVDSLRMFREFVKHKRSAGK